MSVGMTAAKAVPVDPSNTDQFRAWDGAEGGYWADNAEHFDRSVAVYHQQLLKIAAIGERDRVLDVGCGTGQSTRDAARAASGGSVLGVDLSLRVLDYARRRATDQSGDLAGGKGGSNSLSVWPRAKRVPTETARGIATRDVGKEEMAVDTEPLCAVEM